MDAAVAAARAAFDSWSTLPKEQRKDYLLKIQAGLEARADELAESFAQRSACPSGCRR